jgi:hypothetical protein
MPGIIRGTSLLNLGVRLSPHPASDVLRLRFCSCVCNRGNSRELLLDYFSDSWRGFRRCDAGEPGQDCAKTGKLYAKELY